MNDSLKQEKTRYEQNANRNPEGAAQDRAPGHNKRRHLNLVLGLGYQLVAFFLFVVALGFVFYFLSISQNGFAIAFGFTAFVLMLIALALFVLDRLTAPSLKSNETNINHPLPNRIKTNKTIEQLTDIFKKHTNIQATKLTEPYIGTWIDVGGKVYNVSSGGLAHGEPRVSIVFDPYPESSTPGKLDVTATFTHPDGRQIAETLNRDDEIKVAGRIRHIDSFSLFLDDCEFID